MKKLKTKNAGAILILWIVFSSILSAILTIWILDNSEISDARIFIIIASIFLALGLWILFPSLGAEEKDISLKKAKKFIKCGKPGKAIAELESILDQDSSDSTAKDLLEECHKKYGKE